MKRITLAYFSLALAALVTPALSHAEVSCTRPGLEEAVDLYLAAQAKGDPSALPLAKGIGYYENAAPADIHKGFINKPLKIDDHRSLLDTATCQTFTQGIVTDKAAPYVFGTRLRVNHDKIAERISCRGTPPAIAREGGAHTLQANFRGGGGGRVAGSGGRGASGGTTTNTPQ
jgi:hypothetical protein